MAMKSQVSDGSRMIHAIRGVQGWYKRASSPGHALRLNADGTTLDEICST